MSTATRVTLDWKARNDVPGGKFYEAILGEWPNDGVRFSITVQPTCYRRGQFRLLVEVCPGHRHFDWGCFDEADQPMRYYHQLAVAKSEAQCIADVLWRDRYRGEAR